MKYVLLFFLSLLIPYFVAAQSNFRIGYIITNTNDSINGWIDFQTDKINNQVCYFKQAEKANVQAYYPGDIAKYRFINEGKYYVSHSITIDNKTYQVFLEFLVNGMMNLYYYKEPVSDQDYYFFEDETGKMTPVSKKPDEIVDSKLKTDQRYIGALNFIFKDYPSLQKDIKSTSFNKGNLIKLTKDYHALTCNTGKDCIEFENDYKKTHFKFRYSIYSGIQTQNYLFKEAGYYFSGSSNYIALPMIGGQFSFSNPQLAKSFSLLTDVSFSGIKGKIEQFDKSVTYIDYEYTKYTYNASSIALRENLIYTYPNGKFRPILEGGLSVYLLFNKSTSWYYEAATTPVSSYTKYNWALPSTTFIGYNFGTGFDFLVGKDHFLFCRISFERVAGDNVINSRQLKVGFMF